jgi:hypothetical protein
MIGRRLLVVTGVFLALALAASPVSAAPAVGSQFAGTWVSTDFDGSTQVLLVSAGRSPRVTYQDFYASACDNNGSPSTHWVAAGRGTVTDDLLEIVYHKSGCGWFTIGPYGDFYFYDSGTDTLTDSVGNVWTRTT